MEDYKLQQILKNHKEWLVGLREGNRADLREADLQEADLREADLQEADLRGADLREANLQWADLRGADLREANLRGADLRGADLRGADLQEANLREADLDFSCWPLWCGSKQVKVSLPLVYQLLAHVAVLNCEGDEFAEIKNLIMPYAVKSHRAKKLGLEAQGERK